MKKASALAVLDYQDIPSGIFAVDAILKKAPITFIRAGTTTRGRYLVLFGGSTASTAESLNEAMATTESALIDHAFLPDVHPALFDGVFGAHRKAAGALLVIETETASSIVRAVEAASKERRCELIEIRLVGRRPGRQGHRRDGGLAARRRGRSGAGCGGFGVNAAAPRGFSHRLIAAPHEVLERDVMAATRFDAAPLLELDGELG